MVSNSAPIDMYSLSHSVARQCFFLVLNSLIHGQTSQDLNALSTWSFLLKHTYLVVGFAVGALGKRWINGRYTPLLYATCAAFGRVAVGSLTGNAN